MTHALAKQRLFLIFQLSCIFTSVVRKLHQRKIFHVYEALKCNNPHHIEKCADAMSRNLMLQKFNLTLIVMVPDIMYILIMLTTRIVFCTDFKSKMYYGLTISNYEN